MDFVRLRILICILIYLPVIALAKAETIPTKNIDLIVNFEFAHSTLDSRFYDSVKKIAQAYSGDQDIEYKVFGHTCWIGSEDVNDQLAIARANEVKRLLVHFGVPKEAILTYSYGERRPRFDNTTEEGRKKNRRTEVRILNVENQNVAAVVENLEKSEHIEVQDEPKPEPKFLEQNKVADEEVVPLVQEDAPQETVFEGESTSQPRPMLTQPPQEVADKKENLNEAEKKPTPITEPEPQPHTEQPSKSKPHEDNLVKKHSGTKGRYYLGLSPFQNILTAKKIREIVVYPIDAEWVSRVNLSFEAAYQRKINKNIWTGLSFGVDLLQYKNEQDDDFEWDEKTPFLWGLSWDTHYEKNNYGLGFKLNLREDIFIEENNFDVTLNKGLLLGLGAFAQYVWYRSERYRTRLEAGLDYPAISFTNSDQGGQLGLSAGLGFTLTQVFSNHDLDVLFYGGRYGVKNSNNKQEENFWGLSLKFRSKEWL